MRIKIQISLVSPPALMRSMQMKSNWLIQSPDTEFFISLPPVQDGKTVNDSHYHVGNGVLFGFYSTYSQGFVSAVVTYIFNHW